MSAIIRAFDDSDSIELSHLSDDEWKIAHIGAVTLFKQSDNKTVKCFIAHDGEKIVGYIYGFVLPNKTLIPEFLYVLPEYRQKGLGKKLIQFLEDNTGCTVSMIFYNKSLHNYYQKQGYKTGDNLETAIKEVKSNG